MTSFNWAACVFVSVCLSMCVCLHMCAHMWGSESVTMAEISTNKHYLLNAIVRIPCQRCAFRGLEVSKANWLLYDGYSDK